MAKELRVSLAIDTRNAAFFNHRDSGDLGRQQRDIMLLLHGHPERDWSLQEISKALHMQISSVSGRCRELKDTGWLDECAPRKCSVSGRRITPVRASGGQMALPLCGERALLRPETV